MDKLTDADIYSYYLGDIKPGKLINSPLRGDDKIPSFAIFRSRRGDLLFKDHGSGESGNALQFVKLMIKSDSKEDLEKELLRIIRKVNPGQLIRSNTYVNDKQYETDIGIVRQPFTEVDKQYWSQFHISIGTLERFNVFSIKYFLCNRVVRGTYKEDNPMYAYKVFDRFKIYRPLASKYTKWRTNLTNSCVQGLAELPQLGGNLLIITKSLKDVMCLYEMGFSAIAASSETTFIPDDILSELKDKWKHIVILFDRDETGVKRARKLSKEYNMEAFFVNKRFKAKDISDAVKNNGFNVVHKWMMKETLRYDKQRKSAECNKG